MSLTLPSLVSPVVDTATGHFTLAWIGFFRDLLSKPGPIVAVAPTASPFSWKAVQNGTVAVSGGTGVSLQFTRARVTVPLGIAQGLVPMSQGDVLVATYTTAPTLRFIPRPL